MRLWIFFLLAFTASCAEPKDAKHAPSERELADAIMAAPPELAADLLLNLVDKRKISDHKWKKELTETAYSLALSAKYPTPMVGAVWTDTDSGILAQALDQHLNGSDLQARAVQLMIGIDLKQSREMFLDMRRPSYTAVPCTAVLHPASGLYYKTASDLARTFTAEERKKGDLAAFESSILRGMTIPSDLGPTLSLFVLTTEIPGNSFLDLYAASTAALDQMNVDDRTYTEVTSRDVIRAVSALASYCRGQHISPATAILACRAYLVRHGKTTRCGAGVRNPEPVENVAQEFNEELLPFAPDIPKLSLDDLKPTKAEEPSRDQNYLSSEPEKALLAAYKHLRFGTSEQQTVNARDVRPDSMAPFLSDEERSTPAWNEELGAYLENLDDWTKEQDQTTISFFNQRCIKYSGLLKIVPDGDQRGVVLHQYLRLLSYSPIERESPPEWALHVRRLIRQMSESKQRERWLTQIESEGDSVIAVYIRAYRLFGF